MLTYKITGLAVNSKLSVLFGHLASNKYTKLQALTPDGRSIMSSSYNYNDSEKWYSKRIGNREVVGFGVNGEPEYVDRVDFPFPSIRYKTPSPEVLALREKEKGDWRLLSIEEKKEIYRANFCQTYVEMQAPSGEWKLVVGCTLILVSIGFWMFIWLKIYVYSQTPLPESFSPDWQKMQLRRMLNSRVNPVIGLSSKWDYEKKKWKKKPFYIPWDDPFEEVEPVICEEDL